MKINNKIRKIVGVAITILLLISSSTTMAIGICEGKIDPKILHSSEITVGNPYKGHLRVYVVEPVSRWDNYDGDPYHFGFLDFAFSDKLSIERLQLQNLPQ